MNDQPTIHQMPTRQMELDILKAIDELGPIGYQNGRHTPASVRLTSKYKSYEEGQQLAVVLNFLLEQRLLFPYFNADGKELRETARGITPTGLDRLDRLQHPVHTWICDNWFGVVVATIASLIGIANVVVSVLLLFRESLNKPSTRPPPLSDHTAIHGLVQTIPR